MPMDSESAELNGLSIVIPMFEEVESLSLEISPVVDLCKNSSVSSEIIVVSNNINKSSERHLHDSFFENIHLVRHKGDLDIYKVYRSGALAAKHSVIFFLQPGIKMPPQSWPAMLRYFKHKDTFAVSPLIVSPEGRISEISLQIPYMKRGKIRLRKWNWQEVIPCLPRPLITFRNFIGAVLVCREKFFALDDNSSPNNNINHLCINAWQRGWRCYTASEVKVNLSHRVQEFSSLSSGEFRSIPKEDISNGYKGEPTLDKITDVFTEYYGQQQPVSFKTVISKTQRRAKLSNLDYRWDIELALAARLREAYVDTAIIDIGCGGTKFPGAIGVDLHHGESVDLVHNLDEFPWPIQDESCDLIIASHIMEHVRDFGGVLLESCRVLRPEGTLIVRCPHFSCRDSYRNPTHVRHLTYDSMCLMLTPKMPVRQHDLAWRRVPLTLIQTLLTFRGGARARFGSFLANRKPRVWEQYWSRVLPAREICWVLRKLTP